MKYLLSALLLLLSASSFANNNPIVVMDTSKGKIVLELYRDKAPMTVANFLGYVNQDGFKTTIFHRVIKGFMIQGGGENAGGKKFDTFSPVDNESKNGLKNKRGTIAMARTNFPHSATRQFFINEKDNYFLDAKNGNWGYAVFGKVTEGMEVVDQIAQVKTGSGDRPIEAVVINSVIIQRKQ